MRAVLVVLVAVVDVTAVALEVVPLMKVTTAALAQVHLSAALEEAVELVLQVLMVRADLLAQKKAATAVTEFHLQSLAHLSHAQAEAEEVQKAA